MKEKESACFFSVGLCVMTAFLRMLAPELPFDWMTLVLIVIAAMFPVFLYRHKSGAQAQPSADHTPFETPGIEALHQQMQQNHWLPGAGGLPEALQSLQSENPFVAMCAARGILFMLMAQKTIAEEDIETLSLLTHALDAAAGAGEKQVGSLQANALFAYTMQAIGHIEAAG